MRISMERFVKEVSGQAGTLYAVLAEGATFFVFDAITARLCKKYHADKCRQVIFSAAQRDPQNQQDGLQGRAEC